MVPASPAGVVPCEISQGAPSFCLYITKTKQGMNKPTPIHYVLLFFMRVTMLQLFISGATVLAAYAHDVRGQEVLDRKITLEADREELRDVLGRIEKQADVKFTYRPRLIESHRLVSVRIHHTRLGEVLTDLLGERVDWTVIGRQIVLKPLPMEELAGDDYIPGKTVAPANISGRVTDDAGGALPGVNVLIKGTSAGTTTDIDGKYTLSVTDAGAVLVFTFIGYKTQEIPVNDRSVIDVVLAADVQSLQEIVVVGYGEQRKETVTGSVVTVRGSDLVKSPSVNLSNSLAGRMPGVVAVNRSGEPGADGSSIRIRGSNTLGSNDALIVIDGIPARSGGLERLNPSDIESISVLKDASAAIYGSRAANGVILITTKRGKTGKPELMYSFNQGWSQPTTVPRLADAVQFSEMRNELEIFNLPTGEWNAANQAFKETGSYTRPNGTVLDAPYSPEDFELFRSGADPWGHPNTDWYSATLKNWSPQSRHSLQLSGGTDNVKYMASLGYQNQDAYYRNAATGYKQYDLRINLDANINKYVKTTLGIMGRQENRFYPTRTAAAIFRMQMRGIPTEPAFWPNGMPGPDIEYGENPVVITTSQTGYDRDTRYYVQTNGGVEITQPWIKGLKFTGTASVDKYVKRTKKWEVPWYLYTWDKTTFEDDGVTPKLSRGQRGPSEPRLTMGDEDQLNVLLGGIITYERTFGDHAFTVLAGTNRETVENNSFNAYRRFFISTAVDQMVAGGNPEKNNGGGAWERARLNYFGRVAYNFKEKYLAEFLWRYDGSYMFPEGKRYGFFPGIMAGWQISEEEFWKTNVPIMNYLKLRASWGQLGNDQIYYDINNNGIIDPEELQEYQYMSTNAFRSYIIGGQEVGTIYEARVPNPLVTWEVANNYDLGLEGQFLQGKISFEADIFLNKRSKILWRKNASVPQTTGMTLPAENIGKVSNRGWELQIGYHGQAGELQYNVSVNGGYAKNRIDYWDEAPGSPAWQRTTGKPMYTYQAYIYDGVFATQEEIDANELDYSAITNTLRPGDMKYKDFDGDGRITPDDRVRNDKTNIPTFQGGVNMSAKYRNFDLSILFQGATGAQVYISTGESGSIGNYLLDVYRKRWTIDNPSSEHPRIADRSNQYYSNDNTYWLRSTDYLRLKNIELGYTVPSTLGQRAGINSLRFYVNALNLFTIDKLNVLDPESTGGLGQYYPQARIINMGLTVVF